MLKKLISIQIYKYVEILRRKNFYYKKLLRQFRSIYEITTEILYKGN